MPATMVKLRVRTLILALSAALVVGLGISGLWRDPNPSRPKSPLSESVAHGRARTARGAVRAAILHVGLGQRIYDLPAGERRDALRRLAADGAADGYATEQLRHFAELDDIATRGRGPLTWQVGPLATRVDAFTKTRARVSIWRVGILSIEGLTAPLAEWTTVTYELVWQRHHWAIWSETQVPGPTPMGHPEETPSSPEQWRGALDGFDRFPSGEQL